MKGSFSSLKISMYTCLINLHRLINKRIIIVHFQRGFLFRKLGSSFFKKLNIQFNAISRMISLPMIVSDKETKRCIMVSAGDPTTSHLFPFPRVPSSLAHPLIPRFELICNLTLWQMVGGGAKGSLLLDQWLGGCCSKSMVRNKILQLYTFLLPKAKRMVTSTKKWQRKIKEGVEETWL